MKIKPNLKVNESGFLFDPTTGESYSLNDMGSIYFRMITEGRSLEEIRALVINEYDVEVATFEKSFLDFESRLRNLRLIDNE